MCFLGRNVEHNYILIPTISDFLTSLYLVLIITYTYEGHLGSS